MKMSFLEFMLLLASGAIQGVLLPISAICYARYKRISAIIMAMGSVTTLIASFISAMDRPDVQGKVKMSDFHEGYVQLKAQLQWMYYPFFGGMIIFAVSAVFLVLAIRRKE